MSPVEFRIRAAILSVLFALPAISNAANAPASARPTSAFAALAMKCAPDVHHDLLGRVATVESSGNPFAIGVVGGHLAHQPQTLSQALATVRSLDAGGWNYSMGLIQVNVHNIARFGQTVQGIFDPCTNLKTGAAILRECYERALARKLGGDTAVHAALSCYYTGDLDRGPAYAIKVAASAPVGEIATSQAIAIVPDVTSAPGRAAGSGAPSARAAAKKAKGDAGNDWFTTYGEDGETPRPSGYHPISGANDNGKGDADEN
jgi:type IV secretion system protein VirB1